MPANKIGALRPAEVRQRQNAAVKHGASGALGRLNRGEPFANTAVEVYQQTLARWGRTDAELDQAGMFGDLIREVARHQTVSELCYGLILAAADNDDLDQYERWVKLWRAISTRTIGHMNRLQNMLDNDQTLDYEQILQAEVK